MIKCFRCIQEEHKGNIKWSQVLDGVVVLQGTSYCYNHLNQELDWKELEHK